MTPEQEILLQAILKNIVTAFYDKMGKEWCAVMIDKINFLPFVGKP